MAIQWSTLQNAFFTWAQNGSGSCVLEAVAGSGKTTAIIEAALRMAPASIVIVAYNTKIVNELKERIDKLGSKGSHIQVKTVHALGLAAYRREYKYVKVDSSGRKVPNIVETIVPQNYPFQGMIVKLVSLAKQRALGVIGHMEDINEWLNIADHYDVFVNGNNEGKIPEQEIIGFAQKALRESNNVRDLIDFDDMIYMPLYHKMPFWRYDVVMVDEAQDTNPARRALVAAALKKGGRLIAVGDRHQAIYGFTGADNDSLEQIKRDFGAIELPLTTTYRCPKAVVKYAQQWVKHIEAHESAPEGKVSSIQHTPFLLMAAKEGLREDAVLCRVTKPLVSLAFTLIRNKVACKVEGRDIGQNLKKLITKWKGIKTLDKLTDKLDTYLERETTKCLAKKQETKAQQIEDMVETVRVIIDQCEQTGKHAVSDALAYVDELFAEDVKGMLVLSTIHKSKGREWNRVFWLDRDGTCPSKWARQAWQQDQEVNLMYVAATRAKNELVELEGEPTTKGKK